jgi:hypothetical protein
MEAIVMTVLAELRSPAAQEFVVIAAVGNMTIQAILIHRRMGPHKGAPFLGMALITKFIDGIPLELGGAKTSMGLVAVRAFHFSFPDRMVRGPFLLRPYTLMTEIAEVRLGGL